MNTWIQSALDLLRQVLPNPTARAEAELKLLELHQAGAFKEDELRYSAILAEANSDDKWTSRARPSIMYVGYFMILFSIPMGALTIFRPEAASAMTAGMSAFLNGLPQEFWWLFGVAVTGYNVGRSYEKGLKIRSR